MDKRKATKILSENKIDLDNGLWTFPAKKILIGSMLCYKEEDVSCDRDSFVEIYALYKSGEENDVCMCFFVYHKNNGDYFFRDTFYKALYVIDAIRTLSGYIDDCS